MFTSLEYVCSTSLANSLIYCKRYRV